MHGHCVVSFYTLKQLDLQSTATAVKYHYPCYLPTLSRNLFVCKATFLEATVSNIQDCQELREKTDKWSWS